MSSLETQFGELLRGVRRDPLDADRRRALERLLDQHPAALRAMIPPDALRVGVVPGTEARRLRFITHLLLHGYDPPRVEQSSGSRWRETINLGVITAYFYPHALSLLEAGRARADVGVFVAQPVTDAADPWITIADTGVALHTALMLDDDGLVWRTFRDPVAMHYLFPVDNYYRDKWRLVRAYATTGVPMPGSALIRDVCENKQLLSAVVGSIPGLRLAREIVIDGARSEDARAAALDRFCEQHKLRELVTKPLDGFGGIGIEFWRYPRDRERLLAHLRDALQQRSTLLIQERISPVPTRSGYDWNIRQYVLRCGPDDIRAPWKRVRIGEGAVNTTQGARSLTIEQLRDEIDVRSDQRAAFDAALAATDALSIAVLRALQAYLESHYADQRVAYIGSGSNLEPDLLALDFMIGADPDRPEQFAIFLNEINDFASGGMRDYEVLAHRQMLPDAPRIEATHSFSLAPAILDLVRWRGGAYRQAIGR